MERKYLAGHLGVVLLMAVFHLGIATPPAGSATNPPTAADFTTIRTSGQPDINGWPNWANSPPLRKFVDGLPGLCNDTLGNTNAGGKNLLNQCIPVAVADKTTFPGSDYYEIEIVQYREQMHSDLPAVSGGAGGTLLRGYRQTNTTNADVLTPHYLGPMIVATKDRPVRIKFTNSLPAGSNGNLFIPTDTTVMGSGPGPTANRPWISAIPARTRTDADFTDAEICENAPLDCFRQNRANIHLHGGRTPWISDGTAHQWITPDAEFAGTDANYSKGVSVAYVPDMWFLPGGGAMITNTTHPNSNCAGNTFCSVTGATNNPGEGAQTYYYTNAQSARLMFYHDHSWGITRLGVYAGEAAPYVVTDAAETTLALVPNLLPPADKTIPLVIQDKTYVNADVNSPTYVLGTDPTWIWGSKPGTLNPLYHVYDNIPPGDTHPTTGNITEPVTGDLWWPHVYVPAQNPEQLDGINDFGRWHYGPWFWPPVVATYGPKANPYAALANQPSQVPDIPNPSWGAEAFLDTPVINGTAYPKLTVTADKYRFRILNASHDRFYNLQLYVANNISNTAVAQPGFPAGPVQQLTEVKMVAAVANPAYPGHDGLGDFVWPADSREGGVPDPATRGPALVQIGTDGGFLPAPVVLPNRPVLWNVDPTTFTAGLVLQQNQGGGTLMLGPAERADIIVDFSQFAGKTLILYNDAPAPWPALDPHYDYYTNSPIYSDIGGAPEAYPDPDGAGPLLAAGTPTPPGYGPNTRTLMKIVVGTEDPNPTNNTPPNPSKVNAIDATNLTALNSAFTGPGGIFAKYQDPIIVGQSAYNAIYSQTFPGNYPYWGISRIIDNAISFKKTDGGLVTAYPMEPKAIQDEMGEVFDEFGRMSAKLGLEMARTTAGIQTFILQNFVDPPTEIVARDQVQIWKITHNGVDTHPVHFHLFEVQLLNRVGWDGFIYLPDANELGWKDTVRVSPLEDTIVALRPAKIPTPFNVPNSLRPLNPAYPLGVTDAGFTGIDPVTGNARTTPVVNEVINFGHEFLWHCHILSHEESDMMRVIVSNANSLLYTDNGTSGFWEWNRGDWSQIAATDPSSVVASGTHAYAKMADGLYEWNGYTWRRIDTINPTSMVASTSGLYADFAGSGLYYWNGSTWTKINSNHPASMVASASGLYADFAAVGLGLYYWNGSAWTKINSNHPFNMVASGSNLYANFTLLGLYQWNGTVWTKINSTIPTAMAPSGPDFYASFTGSGLYKWKGGGSWTKINSAIPTNITASGSILFATFNGGVQKYELGSWSPLLNTTPVTSMVAGF
jgi:FtsP/CotA-like multicopper oxidase with cupredoxin domain